MAKPRVHELAKELGTTSKIVLEKLKDMGEFVSSASSTLEAPVVRRVKEAFADSAPASGKAGGETEQRRTWPIEVRPVDPPPYGTAPVMDPEHAVWFRARAPLGDDPMIHQCALAYATDMTLLDTSLRPHGIPWSEGRLQVASLDHALWFHHPSDFTTWHLYVQDSPSASGGRGFNRGSIFDSTGKLVASATQEALIRYR